jgi:ABC-type glycerol-3-phosphate transport system permease component
MATVATLANVVLAFAAAYLLVRKQFRGKAALGALVILPWALPGRCWPSRWQAPSARTSRSPGASC